MWLPKWRKIKKHICYSSYGGTQKKKKKVNGDNARCVNKHPDSGNTGIFQMAHFPAVFKVFKSSLSVDPIGYTQDWVAISTQLLYYYSITISPVGVMSSNGLSMIPYNKDGMKFIKGGLCPSVHPSIEYCVGAFQL